MKKLVSPFKVGLLTLAGLAALVWVIGQIQGGVDDDQGVRVYADFNDATGLVKKSRVQVAGINVGEIESIELVGDKARVWLIVDTPLFSDAAVMRKQASLLGDYYLRLYPGTKEPVLEAGEGIPKALEETGPAELIVELKKISADIASVTGALEKVLGGDKGEKALQEFVDNLNASTRAINQAVTGNQENFDRIIGNIGVITDDVRDFTGSTGKSAAQILAEVQEIVHEVNLLVGRSKGDVGESIGTLKGTLSKLQETLTALSGAVDNVTSITQKIDEGRGTVGKLINDDHLAQELDTVVAEAGDLVQSVTGMQTVVGLRGEYNFGLNALKNYLTLRFQPREDKYYLIEIVDDPRGSTKVTKRTLDTQDPTRPPVIHETETVTTDELKFTLQFAKEYYFLTGRWGIIENTGGMGGNLRLLDDRLDIAVDLFDFGTDRNPRVRMSAQYEFFNHMFLVGGFDDVLNITGANPGEVFFLGASLRFTDNDLKALMMTAPAPSM